MKRIGLISDTHSFLGDDVIKHLKDVDEIWHAGDIGNPKLIDQLEAINPVKGVYGNIDSKEVKLTFPLNNFFECEGVSVFMTHIGGYPGRYTKRVKEILLKEKPQLYICGHSHICKVLKDVKLDLIHMNPGACGHEGFHQFRTMLLFDCHDGKVGGLKLVELGRRGQKYMNND
ncbi:MAG: metallophosphoesterase family protein [Saprospiraceae bacterium]|nr:metallophosphatase family protein [Bacteroidia bacterium]NNE14012.1 metallophosphoesterase family protein [Saprospiraceae bacterium]NNL92808.1 metallophosphoesterase family protein [Saprospiraceae bacterium]